MIDFTPSPVAIAIGPLEIRWYGVAYVAAIVAATWLAFRLARKRGERTDIILDSLIVMAIAALIGGRAYHVIDQWAYYKDHLAQIVLPPYSGLGIYATISRSGAGATSSLRASCLPRLLAGGATS